MGQTETPPAKTTERVEWRLSRRVVTHLEEFCAAYHVPVEQVVEQAILQYVRDRLLEEGE